jgi:hypothetical protein
MGPESSTGSGPIGDPAPPGPPASLNRGAERACARRAPSSSSAGSTRTRARRRRTSRRRAATRARWSRLYQNGAIDAEQLASAVEIALVAERIGRDVAVRTASLETRVDVTRSATAASSSGSARCGANMPTPNGASSCRTRRPVLDMLVGEPVGFTIVARGTGCTTGGAPAADRCARPWPEILGAACKRSTTRRWRPFSFRRPTSSLNKTLGER